MPPKRTGRRRRRSDLHHHPFAKVFPILHGDDLRSLAEDIRASGLRVPITLFKGRILDGRNRYAACKIANVKPRFETFSGTDAEALAMVVSLNIARRHLSTTQRAALAIRLLPFEKVLAQKRQTAGVRSRLAEGVKATQAAGRRVSVSGENVRLASTIAARAPDVIDAMTAGTVSTMPEAVRVSCLPSKERMAVLSRMAHDGLRAEEALTVIRADRMRRRSRMNIPREVRQPRYRLVYGRHVIDALRDLPDDSVHMVATSPPYFGQRDYFLPPVKWTDGWKGQLGLEPTPEMYVGHLVEVFRDVRRVLRPDGSVWLNLGDSFWGGKEGDGTSPLKPKDMIGIPWTVALALRNDGWYLRSDVIWHRGVCRPESVEDRPVVDYEHVFLLAKTADYYFDPFAIREPGIESVSRQRRSVWKINTRPQHGVHTAAWPPELVEVMILAGSSERGACSACGAPWKRVVHRPPRPRAECRTLPNARDGGLRSEHGLDRSGMSHGAYARWLDAHPPESIGWEPTCTCGAGDAVPCVVLDPFSGSAVTGAVALQHGRNYIGIDLCADYLKMAERRIQAVASAAPA